MGKAELQQQAVELINQLSTEKLKAGIDYLTYLRDEDGGEATHELASVPKTTESLGAKPMSKNPIAQRIIEAVEKSHDVTLEDAEGLLQVIKENQMPMRFNSPFAANEPESQ